MSKSKLIEKLRNYRTIIMLFEIASLFHDLGKCSSNFIESKQKSTKPKDPHGNILEYDKSLISKYELDDFFKKTLIDLTSYLPEDKIEEILGSKPISIKDSIENHHSTAKEFKKNIYVKLLKIADKKDSADSKMSIAKQEKETYICSAFGKEDKLNDSELDNLRENFYKELSKILSDIPRNSEECLKDLRKRIYGAYKKFTSALAETRRAANDITLMDHSYAVASIAKSSLAQVFLSGKIDLPKEHTDLNLKILGIAWNMDSYCGEAHSLSGVLGREALVEEIKFRLKELLEWEIPVGNAIYEDRNSILFLAPENIDVVYDDLKLKIMEITNELTKGSLIPVVEISEKNPYPSKIITKIQKVLEEKTSVPFSGPENVVLTMKPDWDGTSAQVCVQCGRRFRKIDGEFCEFCTLMMQKGAKTLKERKNGDNYAQTLWIDEMTDENGYVAMIYGSIPIQKWLNGDLLKTMLVKKMQDINENNPDKNKNDHIKYTHYSQLVDAIKQIKSKVKEQKYEEALNILRPFLSYELDEKKFRGRYNDIISRAKISTNQEEPSEEAILEVLMTKSPSPSRIFKIWNEIQDFFEELSEKSKESLVTYEHYCLRLKFKPRFFDNAAKDLESIENVTLSVEKFDPEAHLPKSDLFWDGNHMYTTLRLEHYVEGEDKTKKEQNMRALFDRFKNSKAFVYVEIKNRSVPIGIESYELEKYLPLRTITTSPSLFAIMVPGKVALSLLYNKYITAYETRFSKVSDRLPFNMGVVFFKRKFPLYVVMDVMRRSKKELDRKSMEFVNFKIVDDKNIEIEEKEKDKAGMVLEIESRERKGVNSWLSRCWWRVDDKLGDGSQDLYHPNFIVVPTPNAQSKEPFKIITEGLEHLNFKDLEPGMSLKIYPGYFDFHFLRSSGERFTLFSRGTRVHPLLEGFGLRPYLLKDLKKIVKLWDIINPKNGKLTASQIKNLEYACKTKIEEWSREGMILNDPSADKVYREFVELTVENVCKDKLNSDEKSKLAQSILSGIFFDVVELFITIGSELEVKKL